MLTEDQFKKALPDRIRKSVDLSVMNHINNLLADPNMGEVYRENLLSYTRVLQDGKYKIESYVNAIKYVTHKFMGCTNVEAYSKTFPDRMARFAAEGTSSKDISSYVAAYNQTALVKALMEQALTPVHLLNLDLFQKALNVQAELMMNANSEKVRCDAANSLLTHLKRPDTQKIELDVAVKEDSSIDSLRAATLELVAQQRAMLKAGAMSAVEVAQSKLLIEGEAKEID